MTTAEIEGWVLDYACKFNHHEVIAVLNSKASLLSPFTRCKNCSYVTQALHHRYGENLSTICEVEVRLCAATLHRIVHCRELEDFDTAVELVEDLYSVIRDHCPRRVYYKLVFPLKIMVLLNELKNSTNPGPSLNLKLNEYIPRCGILDNQSQNKDMERLQKYLSNFRKFYLSLLSNKSQRRAYIEEELEADFGEDFKKSLEKPTSRFLEEIEKCLPPTVIEKMLEKGTREICENVPSISASLDILLECLCNKIRLDTTDLLDLLTLIHPISTQDRFQHQLHLTFGSDESSNDSRLMDLSTSPAVEERIQSEGSSSKITPIHCEVGSSKQFSPKQGTERKYSTNSPIEKTVESSIKISPIQRNEGHSGKISLIRSSKGSCSKISASQKRGKSTSIQKTKLDENPTQIQNPKQTRRQSSDLELSPSGESVSIISKRPPAKTGFWNRKTEMSRVPPEDPLSQVYLISSSSDSATTQGSQGQGHEEQTNSSESTHQSHCDSSNDKMEDNLMSVDSSLEHESSGDISNSFGLIPSSIMEEMQEPELETSRSPAHVRYPSIREHQKRNNVRLCVIKLYRDKDMDIEVDNTHMELYS